MKFYIFLIVFLSLSTALYAQTTVALNPVDGMPPGVSDNLSERFGPSYHFALDGKPFFNDFYLVHRGDAKNTVDNFWIFRKNKNDKGYTYSNVVFEKDSVYGFIAEDIFITDSEDQISPLLIYLDKDDNFSYGWKGSKSPEIVKKYPYKVGSKLPDINLVNISTNTSLKEFSGKIVVINWWETACTACILEIPGLNKLVEKYPGIEFVSIINDQGNLESFLEKHPFNYRHYYGDDYILEILAGAFPRNIILDRNGLIVYNKIGAFKDTYKELEKVLLTLKK